MITNRIGQTDVHVSDLSFGCSGIGNLYRDIPETEAAEVLACAWDAGIRYFDTAPHYGRGLSEQRLGAFLKGRARDSFAISTKVGRLLSPGQPMAEANGFINPLPNDVRYDYSGDGIEASFEQSCERLGTSYIDIIYVHDIGTYAHGDGNVPHFDALMSSGLERLQKLKAAGRIGAFGLGVNETQVCLDVMRECPLDVILLAGRLTLLDRQGEEELVGRCQDAQTSLVLGGIFNSGILATGPVPGAHFDYQPASDEVMEQVAQLQSRADEIGVPLATVAMQYARRHPAAASVLLGTGKVSSLKRNLDALDVPWDTASDWVFDPV
ncbi:D-threo-aldose 1-dehydrogenase [Aliiroseovarius halocynthiae]|uniref:Aldo/keto reductase n=1 Tax=Aliiroseovarius halocynthiae TaxID=985055 RepID=A0A545SL55_9RHOB|nr:aldo/keto reductase [Aliiroseovarius halocynthiae]TQV65713.1 aldo/keto reductase [Aliiroseovarius halocynthiae]SMR83956.1 D-threo-aldose 1-dehydrogenase [Aliiroseovarius halocynthiae]